MSCYISEEHQPRIGVARTMDALDMQCSALTRSFNATADASIQGLPLPAIRECLAELVRDAKLIATIADAQIGRLDEMMLEAAE